MNIELLKTKAEVLADNDMVAEEVRDYLQQHHVYFVNLMGSPGAGKTTVLLSLLHQMKKDYSIGVIEADVESMVDAETIGETGVKVLQVHTGGSCHMDASMTLQALRKLDCSDLDLVILENVGNLVCPAEFDVGADLQMMVLSVPEGDDKPLKYPLMFQVSDLMVINKADTKEIFDFDTAKVTYNARKRNPQIEVLEISALHKKGTDALEKYLRSKIDESHRIA